MFRQIVSQLFLVGYRRLVLQLKSHQVDEPLPHLAVAPVQLARVRLAHEHLVVDVLGHDSPPLGLGQWPAGDLLPRTRKPFDSLASDIDAVCARCHTDGREQPQQHQGA